MQNQGFQQNPWMVSWLQEHQPLFTWRFGFRVTDNDFRHSNRNLSLTRSLQGPRLSDFVVQGDAYTCTNQIVHPPGYQPIMPEYCYGPLASHMVPGALVPLHDQYILKWNESIFPLIQQIDVPDVKWIDSNRQGRLSTTKFTGKTSNQK